MLNKKISIIRACTFTLFFIVFFLTSTIFANEIAPQEVINAAHNGLEIFLSYIPENELAAYGFSNIDEIKECSLGTPLRIYTLSPDNLGRLNQNDDITSFIQITNLWFFPVYSKDKVKNLLTVDFVNGQWKTVAMGSAELAKDVDSFQKNFFSQNKDAKDFKFLRIYQAKSDFFLIQSENKIKLVPLKSAKHTLKLQVQNKKDYEGIDAWEILPILKQEVRKNMGLN